MSSRRDFLKHLGPVIAAGSALTVSTLAEAKSLNADEFDYRGMRVRWSGWQRPVNQIVVIGFWYAFRKGERKVFYQTTVGSDGLMNELDVIDVSWYEGWPRPTPMELSSPEDFEAVKRRAKVALLTFLDRSIL